MPLHSEATFSENLQCGLQDSMHLFLVIDVVQMKSLDMRPYGLILFSMTPPDILILHVLT